MSIYQNPKVLSRIKSVIAAKKKAVNKDHLCMLPSCSEIAINSHIIQRSRFLEPISNKDKKLMCLQTREMYPGKLPKFQRIAIRGILTFKGFCKLHDEQVFSEIEKNDFDLTNQKHLILFNYRALCHELRKKMIIVEWMQESIGNIDDITPAAKERYNRSLNGFKLGIKE